MADNSETVAVDVRGEIPAHAVARFKDFASMGVDSMRFNAPVSVGAKMSRTKEGFLICRDVKVARTGQMLYREGEIGGIKAGRDGVIRVNREEDEVFRAETLASFEGKTITNDHPDDDVTPDNWKKHAVGTMINVRRGAADSANFMLADLLVMDKEAIADILSGKREVSLGYDAEYEQIEPGVGRQKQIIGNHISLVDRGRCGPSCAIRDRSPQMSKTNKIADALRRAFKAKDADELERVIDETAADVGHSTPVVNVYTDRGPVRDKDDDKDEEKDDKKKSPEDRLRDAEAWIKDRKSRDEKEEKDKEDAEKAKDSEEELLEEGEDKGKSKDKMKDAETVYTDFTARSELLAPGVKMPRLTKDAMSDSKKTMDGMCLCKRRALDAALNNASGKAAVLAVLAGRTIDKLTDDAVAEVFVGASEVVRAANNKKALVRDADTTVVKTIDAHQRRGLDQINHNFWSKHKSDLDSI